LAIANPAPSETAHASASMSADAIHVSLPVQRPLISISAAPTAVVVAPDQTAAKGHNGPQHAANQASVTASRICYGNPTSAPPAVPVGPRAGHPQEPPVTHPGPGGCGHKA